MVVRPMRPVKPAHKINTALTLQRNVRSLTQPAPHTGNTVGCRRSHSLSSSSYNFKMESMTRRDARIRLGSSQKLVGLARVELATRSLGNCCSIHLSYSP